jgi:hypothetical protein
MGISSRSCISYKSVMWNIHEPMPVSRRNPNRTANLRSVYHLSRIQSYDFRIYSYNASAAVG